MRINTLGFFVVIGILTAVAATVLTYLFILPEGKFKKFPKIVSIIRDIFNFKTLYLEKILQALYILCTLACVTVGFMMMFGIIANRYNFQWFGGWGLLLMIVGPIAVRIAYEALMMGILLVKNTIEINNKLKAEKCEKTEKKAEIPAAVTYTEPANTPDNNINL